MSDSLALFDPIALAASPLVRRKRSTPEKFFARFDKNGPVPAHCPELGPCHIWTGRKSRDGYGLTQWCNVDVSAHKLACALATGPIPAGVTVMHRCDNRPCGNPAHLVRGTTAENNEDMRVKGRARTLGPRPGVGNHNAKLTDDIVRELRAAWDFGRGEPIISIVRRTGLAVGTIHPMLHGKTWRHVIVEAPASSAFLVADEVTLSKEGSGRVRVRRAGGAS